MNQFQLKEIQKVQLTIMDDIHRVCIKHGIHYYIIGGTALGAIRHSGFIPWDVDIDIAMPRKDYENFVTIFSKELDPKFSCHDYRTDKRHFSPHAIVALKDSKVVFSGSENNPRVSYGGYGLYVDVLPLDQVPNDLKRRNIHEKKLLDIAKWRRLKACEVYSCNNWIEAKIKYIVSILIPVPLKYINSKQQEIAQMYNYLPESECEAWCSTLSHYKYPKLCVNKSIWGTPKLYTFEDRHFYGPEKIFDYLTQTFGDFMCLPSLEDQKKCMDLLSSVSWVDANGVTHYIS